jgi:2-polyprenyl-3-methyl-5-hydroxy-6-metoxy-1,4-benzoquinol methylase
MVHYDRCPLCSSEQITVHSTCTDHFISRETFTIMKCTVCGFLFTQDSPDENAIGRYYESADYISHSDTSEGIINKIYRLVRQMMLLRKRGMIKSLTGLKKGNLLDIGSGTGHFASAMKNTGWNVKGIEINKKAREFSASNFGLEIIAPEGISALEINSFDCITLWHVLEHFQDPVKYMADIIPLLKPGGICVIALPNSSSYDAKHYRKFWAAFDVPRHLWHFDPSTFTRFSEKEGMKIEKIMTLPPDVFYISLLSEKYKGSSFSFIKGIVMALWFSFLSAFNRRRSSTVVYILCKAVDQ